DAGAGDLLPLCFALAGHPRWVFEEICRGQATRLQLDRPFRAIDMQGKTAPGTLLRLVCTERADHAIVEAVVGEDAIPLNRSHSLTAHAHIAGQRLAPVMPDAREARAGVAGQEAHEVEDVRSQHHQVLATAPGIFLASAAQLHNVAKTP